MRTAVLVSDLRQRGVAFSVKGDNLVLDAPKGVLDDMTVATLRKQKPAILTYLNDQAREAAIARWMNAHPPEVADQERRRSTPSLRARSVASPLWPST